ncbi:hypothetical protein MVEG_00499 [Podila verticillata NRRL 6337]|nr:hypothetical protein MVEG_00499 [Podila verticillata NRRL 6337]
MDPPPPFEMDGYIYTPLSTSGSISDSRSTITAWPTFDGSTNLQHHQHYHYQPSKNPCIDFGSTFSTSTTPVVSSLPPSLNTVTPYPAIYAYLHPLDIPVTTAFCNQDVLNFQQQYSSFSSDSNIVDQKLCTDDMRLSPYLKSQNSTSHSTLSMTHVDPVALVLSGSSQSSKLFPAGLSNPETEISSSLTSADTTDQDNLLHPFLIENFSRSLSLSPSAVASSVLPLSSTVSASLSSTSLTKSNPSPVNIVPAHHGLYMPDGTVYHFNGTSLVRAPLSRMPTTIEPSLLDATPVDHLPVGVSQAACGYLQVPLLAVDFFQRTSSGFSSSFGPDMPSQTAYIHAPASLMTDFNMYSNIPPEYPQVPTLIPGLRQDISLTTPPSPSMPSPSSSVSSSSPPSTSLSLTASSSHTVSSLEILASLKPSAFRHSLPSSLSSSRPPIPLAKQPRSSKSATSRSSKRITHQQQKKDLCSSSSPSSTSSSSTPTTPTSTKPLGARLPAKFSCPFAACDYRYNLKRELNRHKNTHLFEDKDKYQCLHCNAGLCRLDSVKRHMEAKGKSACLEYGLYQEFKPTGEVFRVKKCKDNWYAAAAAARRKEK